MDSEKSNVTAMDILALLDKREEIERVHVYIRPRRGWNGFYLPVCKPHLVSFMRRPEAQLLKFDLDDYGDAIYLSYTEGPKND